jgi:hypothetical protein
MPQADLDKPIYLALYKLILYLYTCIRNFPKEYKYTLGQDILSLAWKTLDWVILANTVENREKKRYIAKAVSTFNSLKYRFRVASDTEILSHQKYAYIIKQSVEVEKMLKGWFSWSKRF